MELLKKIGLVKGDSWEKKEQEERKSNLDELIQLVTDPGSKLGKRIGQGAYGKIYKIQFRGTEMAVKVMSSKIKESDSYDVKQFKKQYLPSEIWALSTLRHEHICDVYKIIHWKEKTYVLMEYAKGGTLGDKMLTVGHMTEDKGRYYYGQIHEAIIYMHNRNISHKDIKLNNIMIDLNDDIKLIDFGISMLTVSQDGRRVLCRDVSGTPIFMAPEILQLAYDSSCPSYNPLLSDVWSLGCVLYTMVSGSLAFQDIGDIRKLVKKQKAKDWNLPNFKTYSNEFLDIISCMLEPEVAKRWSIQRLVKHPWLNIKESQKMKN